MPNSTDLKSGSASQADGAFTNDTARILVAVADHFTAADPTGLLDRSDLLIAFGSAAYELNGRRSDGGGELLARAAGAVAPALSDRLARTRGEYALLLRKLVADHEWTENDNARAIPAIPGPRTAPAPRPESGRA